MAKPFYPSTAGHHTVIFQSHVAELFARIDRAEDKILAEIGAVVARDAQQKAPVDTGNLANSIDYEVNKGKNEVAIGATMDAPYAPFQEFGTGQQGKGSGTTPPSNYVHGGRGGPDFRGHRAQPFLEPAVVENITEIREIAKRGYRKVDRITELSVRFSDDPR